MVTRAVGSLLVLSAFVASLCAGCASGPPAAREPLAVPLPLGSDAGVTPPPESFREGQDVVPPERSAAADASVGGGSEVDARCHSGPVPTSPAWQAIVAAFGFAHEVFVPCTGESCRPDRPPCQRWEIAFLSPEEDGAPRLEIRRSESYPEGSWIAEAFQLSPFGYPCNDGIDVLCVQWEGCGPTEVEGLGICSTGCPSMERWYVRSSRPGMVEFEWYERTNDEGVVEFGTRTFYASLDECLTSIGPAMDPDASADVGGSP